MKKIVKSSMVSLGLMVGMVSGLSAEVSVPNTFSAGDAASAAQVNENFTALKDGVNVNTQKLSGIATRTAGQTDILTDTDSDIFSITITAPTDGFIHVMATGTIIGTPVNRQGVYIASTYVGVTNTPNTSPEGDDKIRYFYRDSDVYSYSMPYNVQNIFPVSGGENTFYLVAEERADYGDTRLFHNRLTVTFHASEL